MALRGLATLLANVCASWDACRSSLKSVSFVVGKSSPLTFDAANELAPPSAADTALAASVHTSSRRARASWGYMGLHRSRYAAPAPPARRLLPRRLPGSPALACSHARGAAPPASSGRPPTPLPTPLPATRPGSAHARRRAHAAGRTSAGRCARSVHPVAMVTEAFQGCAMSSSRPSNQNSTKNEPRAVTAHELNQAKCAVAGRC